MLKRLLKGFAIVLPIITLIGCGNDNEANGTSGTSGQGDEVELSIFISQPRFKEQYETLLDNFSEDYEEETGVTVTYQLEMPGVNEAAQVLQTRLASNDAPDVFSLHAINELPVFQNAGYLADLSDLDFVDNLLEAPRENVTIGDEVYAAPLETIYWGYLYNEDIFNEYDLEVPTTISEMEDIVNTLNDNGVTPFVRSYQSTDVPQLFLPLVVGGTTETELPDFIDRMNEDNGSFSEIDYFFDAMDLANDNGTERPFEVDSDQGSFAFANGEAAMWVQGPWFAETILASNEDINFQVAPLPINDNPDATLINASASTSLGVSADSEYLEVSKAFVNYTLESEASNEFFQSVYFNPVTSTQEFDTFPWLEGAMASMDQGSYVIDPPIPNAVKQESMRVFQEYLAGSASEEQVFDALDRAWQETNAIQE